jgi:hypothetical protein
VFEKEPEANQASLVRHYEKKLDSKYSDSEHRCLMMMSQKGVDFTELHRSRFRISSQLM